MWSIAFIWWGTIQSEKIYELAENYLKIMGMFDSVPELNRLPVIMKREGTKSASTMDLFIQ